MLRLTSVNRRTVARLLASWAMGATTKGALPKQKVYRIGSLCAYEKVPYFWDQLRVLGFRENQNVEYVLKDVDVADDLPTFATKLVASKVDLIVACGNDEARAALRVTSKIPIVLLYGITPVEAGLVSSLARPGGNLTGSAAISTELARKSIEVFKEAVPGIRTLAIIVDLADPVGRILHASAEDAAKLLGLIVMTWDVTDATSVSKAFAEMAGSRPDGISVSVSVLRHFSQIIELSAVHRFPAMYPFAPAVNGGGLMAYSPDWIPQSRRNAQIVDRILKGTYPSDIPVEQPVRYAFGINLRTARALSLTIPPSVMLQVTWVVE